jgi:hypothetical protein
MDALFVHSLEDVLYQLEWIVQVFTSAILVGEIIHLAAALKPSKDRFDARTREVYQRYCSIETEIETERAKYTGRRLLRILR